MKGTLRGFTIVELLIVIVVIAILAAIGIVAYNGIQERARVSRASAQLSQASKKIALWQVDNPGTIPSSLSDAGIIDASGATYQYRRYDGNTVYCISVTLDGSNSYYASSASPSSISSGNCTDVASVAGLPLASVSTSNTTTSFPSVSGTPDLILYAVFDVADTSGNYNCIAHLDPTNATNRMQLDTGETGSLWLRYRIDTSATINANSGQTARTVGRHIGWLQIRNSLTVREFAYDKASVHNSASISAGNGWNFNQLILCGSGASTKPIAAVAYNAVHDQQTRARVMQWLADTYDVPMTF